MECLLSLVVAILLSIGASKAQAPVLAVSLRTSYQIDPVTTPRLLLCKFTGRPVITVTWTFNGNPLPSSGVSGGVYYLPGNGTLILERAGTGDNGMYQCTASNSDGTASAATELTFIRRPSAPWYIEWYMLLVYAIVLWLISIVVFIIYFFVQKKKAKVPLGDDWIGN